MQFPTTNDSLAPHASEVLSRGRRGVYWSAIFGGAIAATAVSIVLLILGVGLGFSSMSSWYNMGPSAKTLTIAAVIWMIVTQWFSAGLGGYITGRLRNRWHGFHAHESYFRDTVHGFLTWSVATILVGVILSSAAAHSMRPHEYGRGPGGPGEFHADRMGMPPAPPPGDVASGDDNAPPPMPAPNKMDSRMDAMHVHNDMSPEANAAVAEFALYTAFAMLVGAFVASAAAALGGIHRDEYDAKL